MTDERGPPRNPPPRHWSLRTRRLSLDRTLIMGVLNVTPDSFSDGGVHVDAPKAIDHGLAMARDGADIVDVGGESTRPGADEIPVDVELARVVPVIEGLVAEGLVVSIDTMKPEVARQAVTYGVEIINDVSGFRDDAMLDAAVATEVGVVVMHMQGEPRTMQDQPHYDDVVDEIADYLMARGDALRERGVKPDRIVLDPGIGFGKTLEHNLEILRHLDRLAATGRPILVGPSRKRFLGALTGIADPADRDVATAAAATLAIAGGASIIRAHNVPVLREAAQVADAIVRATWRSPD